ncbi:MAG: phytase [Thermoanaerobaculales bacterium]|jgi:3-phytase|nr:phytase [Thermoanaerobaculales bacterium]
MIPKVSPTKNTSFTYPLTMLLIVVMAGCSGSDTIPAASETAGTTTAAAVISPVLITEPTAVDSDDPAIWINPEDPAESLILGTDKGGEIYVFDLDGKIIPEKTVSGLGRTNNIDVAYGLQLGGETVDIAVSTDRGNNTLRAFRLPEMTPVDNGGIEAFTGQPPEKRLPMGLALYTRPSDGALFAFVSRKEGPSGAYLWQYRIEDDGTGAVKGTKVREFGSFRDDITMMDEGEEKIAEIEAIAVDNELGFVYYSDEWGGIKKYHADPDHPDAAVELAVFGEDGFTQDREGISIYKVNDGTGYILVSDQQANAFRIFKREGEPDDPHDHQLVKVVQVSTNESDGSDVTSTVLDERFPSGLFVAMSDNRTFHYYSWDDIAGDDLTRAPNGSRATP